MESNGINITKEWIKRHLRDDYEMAVEYFDGGNLKDFFTRIRNCIEWFGKLVIFDVLNNDVESNAIINGEKKLEKPSDSDSDLYIVTDIHDEIRKVPQGSHFISLAKDAICTKYQYSKVVKQELNSLTDLMKCYSVSSGESNHTNPSGLDRLTQANNIVTSFPSCFNILGKRVLSDDVKNFLDMLPKCRQPLVYEDKVICIEELNNDFVKLDEFTNNFTQLPDVNYIALLPKDINNRYGQPMTNAQKEDFFHMRWCLVIDQDQKTPNGIYENAPQQSIRIILDERTDISGSSNLVNWIFARGREDLTKFTEKETLRSAPTLFAATLSKMVNLGETSDYIIFDFCGDTKLTKKLLEQLPNVFDGWDNVEKRCKIVSFSHITKYQEEIQEWAKDIELKNFLSISACFADFLNHISQKGKQIEYKNETFLIRGNSTDITEHIESFRAVGIEFFGSSTQQNVKKRWDFYSGAEITWEELEVDCDVKRDCYGVVLSRVESLLRTIRKPNIYTLRHRPGSGATTIARRLAYDFRKKEEQGIIRCTVIEIKSCSNIKLTVEYISQLSEMTGNTPILAFVESKKIGREKFDDIVRRVANKSIKMLFFYIEPYTSKCYMSKGEGITLLESILTPEEQKRFEIKYKEKGLDSSKIDSVKNHKLEVVDFPLMLKDDETSDNIGSYVKEWFEQLPKNLKEFCAYVAFVYKYSDSGVNQTLLRSLWRDSSHSSIESYGLDVFNKISKLLIHESDEKGELSGIWRPRYNCFSRFILSAYNIHWENGLSEMAKKFLNLCKEVGTLASEDKEMLYSVFIIRKNADYRAIEDRQENLKSKFSLLIKDLEDIERAESLFESLVKAFPEDAIFRGHYARFLYEKATTMSSDITIDDRLFSDAQEQLKIAFDLNPDDSDLYHMQGMLLRRKLAVLSQVVKKSGRDSLNVDDIQNHIEDWTNDAAIAFERSIQLSPSSPYGYAAESQLYKETIELGKNLKDEKDYSFCFTHRIYSEYVDKLDEVLDQFEQICYAFKSEDLKIIPDLTYKIYETVRAFHKNIIGKSEESIKRYRNLYGKSTGDKRIMYGEMLLKSILYGKSNGQDTRMAYSHLTSIEREEIENILTDQKNNGDIKSYEKLFMLKLYGNEDFSLDDTIDLLKEWNSQFSEGEYYGWGRLNSCFYLAICYCAKAIIADKENKELTKLANNYFKESEELAKKFEKGIFNPQYFLGEGRGIHCIVDKAKKNEEATTITGVIHNIKNNHGLLRMKCGIDVSFNANGFNPLKDEGQTLRGILGFRYSGPGLYEFRPDSNTDSDLAFYEEKTFEQLEKEFAETDSLNEEKTIDIIDKEEKFSTESKVPNNSTSQFKIIGKIDLEQVESHRRKTKIILKGGEELAGEIDIDNKRVFYEERRFINIDIREGFASGHSPKEVDYTSEEHKKVVFTVKKVVGGNHRTGGDFFYATKIRPEKDD